jgi:hypothetical protein
MNEGLGLPRSLAWGICKIGIDTPVIRGVEKVNDKMTRSLMLFSRKDEK